MHKHYVFYIYILTNPAKTVLYVGITRNLTARLKTHHKNRGNQNTFAGTYYCYNLIYYEVYQYFDNAVAREKQIKKWSRKKKENLIKELNPSWHNLGGRFYMKDS